MDEVWLRVTIVVVAGVVGLGVGWLSRRGTALRRRPTVIEGAGPGVVLFTAESCSSCGRARTVVEAEVPTHREIRYEDQPELFERNRIERVPAVAQLDESGRGWIAEGIPHPRLLRRWVGARQPSGGPWS